MLQEFSFNKKHILITGHSSGVGLALCQKMLEAGAHVFGLSRTLPPPNTIGKKYQKNLHSFRTDLNKPTQIDSSIKKIASRIKKIDIIIHSAGIGQRSTVEETKMKVHRQIFEVNFFAMIQIYQLTLPLLKASPEPIWVAISSIQGLLPMPMRSTYAASKYALEGFLLSVHLENLIKKNHIRLCLCRLGFVATRFSNNSLKADGSMYGMTDKSTKNGIAPQIVAEKLMRTIAHEKKKTIVIAGFKERLGLFIYRISPKLFDFIIPKIITRIRNSSL